MMPKLKKTRSFTVSNETVSVDFKGTICECANLLKSGIKNANIILIAYEDVWHEINVLDHGGDDSNLQAFAEFIKTMNLSLVDMGITKTENKTNYELKYSDFLQLSETYPDYSYIEISQLNDHNLKMGLKASMYQITDDLKYLSKNKITIEKHIENQLLSINESIKKTKEMENKKIDLQPVNEAAKKTVNAEVIETPPNKKLFSLQVFETLQPERISELQGVKENQLKIAKDNPVVKITDKASHELAKKTAATLLSASTSIDGKEGIATTANKYLNTFKSMLKNAFDPIAEITRVPYNEQKTIISEYEHAEEIKKQAAERAKLLKIQNRTNELFAVPFTFNGQIYSIGNVVVVPSQIETASDEEFKVLVSKGIEVKKQLDAEASEQAGKDAEIAALKAKLAKLEALEQMSNTETAAENITVNKTPQPVPSEPVKGNVLATEPIDIAAIPTKNTATYSLPSVENKLIKALDLKNAQHLENPNYIKCRNYYIRGLKDVATELNRILNDPDKTVKKSDQIISLAKILLES
jgi:hypothetical protein